MVLTREQVEEIARAVEEGMRTVQQGIQADIENSRTQMSNHIKAAVNATKEAVPLSSGVNYFSGEIGESFEEWLKRFDRLAQANNWDDNRKRDVFPWFLRGLAEQKYDLLTQEQRATYGTIVAALKDHLKLSRMSDLKSVELHARVQGPNEPVTEFASSIRKLTKSAYPELTADMQANLMKRLFLNGLRPDLRRFVLLANPNTFEDAEAQARSQEVQDHFAFGTAPYLNPVSSSSSTSSSTSSYSISAIQSSPSVSYARNSNSNSNNNSAQSRTESSGSLQDVIQRLGKLESGLRSISRNSQSSGSSGRGNGRATFRGRFGGSSRSWTSSGSQICFYCKKPGHHSVVCKDRIRDISARSLENSRRERPQSRDTQNSSAIKSVVRQPQTVSFARRGISSSNRRLNAGGRAFCVDSESIGIPPQEAESSEHSNALSDLIQENSALRNQLSQLVDEPVNAFVGSVEARSQEKRSRNILSLEKFGLGPTVLTSLTFVLCVILLIGTIGAIGTSPYFICGSSRSAHAVSVPQQVKCIPPRLGSEIHRMQAELWVPRAQPLHVVAYKCRVRKRTICTRVGLLGSFGGRSIVADQLTVSPVSVEECWYGITKLAWHDQRLIEIQPGLFSTNNTLDIGYSYCCFDYCQHVSNFILEKGEILTMDARHLASDLGDIGGCHFVDGFCQSTHGMIVWNATLIDTICPFEFSSLQVITMQDNHVLADDLQVAFSFSKVNNNIPSCVITETSKIPKLSLSPQIRMTEQGVILKIYANSTLWVDSLTPTLNTTVWDSSDPVNSKLNYLIYRLKSIENQGFRNVWLELCQVADRQLRLIWQLLRIDATLGTRVLLDRQDVHAQFVGEALMVWQCQHAIPETIFWNYSVDGSCYDMVPVRFKGELWFIVPGSRDLVNSAQLVTCEHHVTGMYQTEFGWRTEQGPAHVSELPISLVWKGMWKAFVFNTPAIFHDKLAGVQSTVAMLRSYYHRVINLDSQLQFLVNYTAEMSLNPEIFQQTFAGIGEGVGSAWRGLGDLVTGIGHGAAELVNGLLKGPLQLFINIIIVLALIISATVCLYCLFSRWCQNKSASLMSFAKLRNFLWGKFHNNSSFPSAFRCSEYNTSDEVNNHEFDLACERVSETLQQDLNNFKSAVSPAYVFISCHTAPLISVYIQNVKTQGLIDTGSNITLISREFFQQLRKLGEPTPVGIQPPDRSALSVSGHSIVLLGKVLLQIQIGDFLLLHQIHVMNDCPRNCLLGTDLLSRFGEISLNLKQSVLYLGDVMIPLLGVHNNSITSVTSHNVNLIEDTVIPGNCEVVLPGHVSQRLTGGEYLFEPSPQLLSKYELLSVPSLSTLTSGIVPVHLLNALSSPIQLYSGMSLGTVQSPASVLSCSTENTTSGNMSHQLNDLDLSNADLTSEQKIKLHDLLLKFETAFAKNDSDLGRTGLVKHHIETGEHAPIKQRPYRVPFEQREVIEKHVSDMLNRGIVEESSSPWSSPVLLVKRRMVLIVSVLITEG